MGARAALTKDRLPVEDGKEILRSVTSRIGPFCPQRCNTSLGPPATPPKPRQISVFGPHLVFVTIFAEDVVPFSVLLASSIVQDGHGMLPMLAHSRRAFIVIKLVNLIVGLAIGAAVMALGR